MNKENLAFTEYNMTFNEGTFFKAHKRFLLNGVLTQQQIIKLLL